MKRSPFKKKPRKKSLASLKKKFWDIFSIFVRRREADENGMTQCISCGKPDHWKNLQAGHFQPKALGLSIYFEPRNVFPQCSYCNLVREGNAYNFAIALKKRFGEGIVEELEAQAKQSKKYYPDQYEALIEEYTKKLEEMGSV